MKEWTEASHPETKRITQRWKNIMDRGNMDEEQADNAHIHGLNIDGTET